MVTHNEDAKRQNVSLGHFAFFIYDKLKSSEDEAIRLMHRRKIIAEKKAIDGKKLKLLLGVLGEAMEKADLDGAGAVIEELFEYTYPSDQMDLLVAMRMAVLDIDAELVEQIIDEWKMLI